MCMIEDFHLKPLLMSLTILPTDNGHHLMTVSEADGKTTQNSITKFHSKVGFIVCNIHNKIIRLIYLT